jgi:hypothetical protein
MLREDRERILSQGVVLPETPREKAQLVELEEDLRSTPARGKPLALRLRNFRPDPGSYLLSAGGPLPYMVRLREIERLTDAHERALEAARSALAVACRGDESAFAAEWTRAVEAWSFDDVNDLIERHNRFYPAEARLPMDPRTRDYVRINGREYRRARLDAAWALARLPAALSSQVRAMPVVPG